MSYTQTDRTTGNQWHSIGTETAGTTATLTLATTPGTGQAHRIFWITVSAIAATVMSIQVTKNDGTTVLGQWNWAGTANSLTPAGQTIFLGGNRESGGLCCFAADQTKIVVTNTGSGAIVINCAYEMALA